jgi:hypothetical protein
MAVSQLRWLAAGFPQRRPGFQPGSGHLGFLVDKVALGHVFSKYFGSPANYSNDCSTLIIVHHPGMDKKSKQWKTYQVDCLIPPLKVKRKNY